MARMIDADRLLRELTALSHGQVWPGWTYDGIRLLIERQATLTQPNEGAKDKNVPANEPLTLEELRMMVEPTPVWWDWVQGWVLARKGMIISWNGVYYNFEEVKGNFYRRPPEGEEEENDVIEITEALKDEKD